MVINSEGSCKDNVNHVKCFEHYLHMADSKCSTKLTTKLFLNNGFHTLNTYSVQDSMLGFFYTLVC